MTKSEDKDDAQLTSMLAKLYTMQEDVGAKDKSSEEEKLRKAATVTSSSASMGRGRAARKAGGRFLELKSSLVDRLKSVSVKLREEAERASGRTTVARGNNPRDVIAAQQEVRSEIRTMEEEWSELDGLYRAEARKRRSRFTPEELEVQCTMVSQLRTRIDACKNAQTAGYGAGGGAADVATTLNVRSLAETPSSSTSYGGGGGGGGAALTEGQETLLQQLEERDADFDRQLELIGDGLQDLAELAQMQGEEVDRQNKMLEGLDRRIDAVNTHVTSVNEKMKETLTSVRSADKICVDIMCIVMAVGFAAVLYNFVKPS